MYTCTIYSWQKHVQTLFLQSNEVDRELGGKYLFCDESSANEATYPFVVSALACHVLENITTLMSRLGGTKQEHLLVHCTDRSLDIPYSILSTSKISKYNRHAHE